MKATASNGVPVKIVTDQFMGQQQFYSPFIKTWGMAQVAASKTAQEGLTGPYLLGRAPLRTRSVDAVYQGGDAADIHVVNVELTGCRAYCSYYVTFRVNVSDKDLSAHAQNGELPIRIQSGDGQTFVISTPVKYFDAVREVANGNQP
jgi:hypothetical protein